jgi:hypothetical protein
MGQSAAFRRSRSFASSRLVNRPELKYSQVIRNHTDAPAKPFVSVILLLLAAAVVYQSSPQRSLSAQVSSAGSDQLYVISNVGVGARLDQVADDGTFTHVGFVSSPGCTFDRFYGMDTAPDGTVYAMARCLSGVGDYWYGRFDPASAKFTRLHSVQPSILDFYGRFNITFPAQFGAPGTPIGYRTRYNNGVGTMLYAIDAIAPYREHLVDGVISPPFANVSIGATISQDGSALFPVSAVETFRLELQPVQAETVTSAVMYGGLGISGNAVVTGIDATGYFSIFDGLWWRTIKPTEPTAVNPGLKLIGLADISGAFLRRAPLGGVRVEPHEQLTTSESGTTATFTAVLTAQPTADVTVSFTSSDTSEGTVSPASATFTPGDWDAPQTITVTGVSDNDNGDQAFRIVTAAMSADANYHARAVLDVDVTNMEVNQLPALTPGSPSAQQGTVPALEATLGTVSDFETAARLLTVTTVTEPAGVTVGTITNVNGIITAPVSASCSATPGANTLTLRVSDEYGESIDQDVTVTVLPNTAPTLGTYSAASVHTGGSTTVTAGAAPGDNGSISLVEVSSPGFTGTLSVDASTGAVSVSNAGSAGVHTITITATDNCTATFSRTFDLTVNAPPTATAVSITGTLLVGELLTGHYTYGDIDGDAEATSTFRWLRGGVAIGGATATSYTTVAADSGQILTFEVTPESVATAYPTGAPVTSAGVTILNSAPTATAATITGTLLVGELLTGAYAFADVDNDLEGTSTFRWLRDGAPIDDATALTYTTIAADSGQVLTFEVTPASATGIPTGTAATSAGATILNSAPTATAVTITGTLRVGEVLTGAYTFTDLDDDAHGMSTFRWLRGGVAIDAATEITYTTVAADSGQILTFEVTPISESGVTTGTAVTSAGATILNSAPTASAVTISGTLLVGELLTGAYTFADVDNDAQGTSTFRWLRNGVAIDGATGFTYSTVAADSGQVLTFEVTPISATGIATGIVATSAGATIQNSAPTAAAVTISGTLLVGELLTGAYTFADVDNDPQGTSTFRWLRGGVAIDGATAITYTTVAADSGQVLTFEVTPTSATGIATGIAAISAGATIFNSVPTATAVTITGTLRVGELLTGGYTFVDLDNDAQGDSTFRWLRGGVAIDGATAITYTTVAGDSGQVLTFEVTPISATGITPGNAATSAGATILNSAPTASAVSISGTLRVGQVLIGAYTFADLDNDAQATSTFRWLRAGVPINSATAITYTTVAADSGQILTFEVTPQAATGIATGTPATSAGVTIQNSAPTASAVVTTQAGFVLTGAYTFADLDGDAEGTSTFRWLRGGVAIPGATAHSYTLVGADLGATITFEVTPIAATGVLAGSPATSTGVAIASIAPAIGQDPVSAAFAIGATATFTAAASGLPAPTVRWQASADGGTTFTDLPGATDVVYTRIVALADHGTKFRAVFSNSAGNATTAAATLAVPGPAATLPSALMFGASANGTTIQSVTPAQTVAVVFGGESFAWTAASNQPWLQIASGNGTGAGRFTAQVIAGAVPAGATTLSATITITAAGATNSPLAVPVTLVVARTLSAPIGVFETPANGVTVEGSIAVTGWALDDVAVDRVEIWRDLVAGESTPPYAGPGPGTGKVFIANAFFITGARPDVAEAYAVLPQADRAGWGYLLLTQGLWNQGNGPFTLYAVAYDQDGRSTVLGSKTITAANATAVRPFGALDTPTYGETVTGSFWNFGWALTPNATPTCTIESTGVYMSIDSAPLTSVGYGDFRPDIAAAFPGYSNGAGAGGAYYVDTTGLTDGIHQIGWYVVDNCGRAEGIGSRFFIVQNGSSDALAAQSPIPPATSSTADASSITVHHGQTATTVAVNPSGTHRVAIAQGERIEIVLPGAISAGYQRLNGERRALPVGSTLDGATGVFYWEPGPGFLGAHDLEFVSSNGDVVRVRAIVGTAVQAVIDTPRADDAGNLPADASFTIAGWAIDEAAAQGTGIDAVHVWAYSTAGGDPIFLGVAEYGDSRPDIAASFGEQFRGASYNLAVDGLSSGEYDVVVYPHSAVTGDFHGAQVVRVTVQ